MTCYLILTVHLECQIDLIVRLPALQSRIDQNLERNDKQAMSLSTRNGALITSQTTNRFCGTAIQRAFYKHAAV